MHRSPPPDTRPAVRAHDDGVRRRASLRLHRGQAAAGARRAHARRPPRRRRVRPLRVRRGHPLGPRGHGRAGGHGHQAGVFGLLPAAGARARRARPQAQQRRAAGALAGLPRGGGRRLLRLAGQPAETGRLTGTNAHRRQRLASEPGRLGTQGSGASPRSRGVEEHSRPSDPSLNRWCRRRPAPALLTLRPVPPAAVSPRTSSLSSTSSTGCSA